MGERSEDDFEFDLEYPVPDIGSAAVYLAPTFPDEMRAAREEALRQRAAKKARLAAERAARERPAS